MSYYRPSPTRFVWGIAIALALAVALVLAARATASALRQDEREKVLTESDAFLRMALTTGARIAHERDSLRALVGQRDTVVIERVRKAKQEAAQPIPPASDTAALVTAVRSCRAQLDTLATECDAFRRAASEALAKADTSRRSDSTVIAGLSTQLAAIRRADSLKATQGRRAAPVKAIGVGICSAAIAKTIFDWSK